MNIYYTFENIEIDEMSEFDFTLDSDVFRIKYSVNCCSINDILIVSEDVEYLKKLSDYADSIPDFDSCEFLKFRDENLEPKRYSVKLNK